jgi:hypothetical protein
MTQEFHLSVTPLVGAGLDKYLVRVVQKPMGVPLGEEQVKFPVEDWLAQAHQIFTDPLAEFFRRPPTLDLLGDDSGAGWPPALVELGQSLYNALFHDTIRSSWEIARGVAQHRQEVLRLRLCLKGDRLPKLPWEVLHQDERPLAASTDVIFSRYQEGKVSLVTNRPKTAFPNPPLPTVLRILMVLAAPTDQANLELKQEAFQLQEELGMRRILDTENDWPDVELQILEHPGREELTQTLEQGHFQVFHFAGHSNQGHSGGQLHLVNANTGLSETLSGDDLAGLLANNGITLAVLNSCMGAQGAVPQDFDQEGERSLAEALVRRGIPSVLAMAERIPDQVALTLSRLFYRNLKVGYPVDMSLCRSRQGLISAYGSNQLYWALPVLYLQPDFEGRVVMRNRDSSSSADLFMLEPDIELQPTLSSRRTRYRDGSLAEPPFLLAEEALLLDGQDPELMAGVLSLESELAGLPEVLALPAELFEPRGRLPEARAVTDRSADRLDDHLLQKPSAGERTLGASGVRTTALVSAGNKSKPKAAQKAAQNAAQKTAQKTAQDASGAKGLTHLSPIAIGVGLGVMGVTLAGAIGLGLRNTSAARPGGDPAVTVVHNKNGPQLTEAAKGKALAQTDTQSLINQAYLAFQNGNVKDGQAPLEQLLNRGDLREAAAAMSAMPSTKVDDVDFSFLRGRHAWQAAQLKDPELPYSVDDARRFWSFAAQSPQAPMLYHQALAFAYYEENDLAQAQQTLSALLSYQGHPSLPTSQLDRDALTSYAGLALVFLASAHTKPTGQQADDLNQAVNLYKAVMGTAAMDYSFEELGKNWLWTPKALKGWQELGKLAGK